MSDNKSTDDQIKEVMHVKQSQRQNFFKERANKSFKHLSIKYQNTRFAQNVDSLMKFKKVYYHLIENQMPILKGGERKKQAKRVEQTKNAIFVGAMVFFFMYNRIGFLNRMMFCLVST